MWKASCIFVQGIQGQDLSTSATSRFNSNWLIDMWKTNLKKSRLRTLNLTPLVYFSIQTRSPIQTGVQEWTLFRTHFLLVYAPVNLEFEAKIYFIFAFEALLCHLLKSKRAVLPLSAGKLCEQDDLFLKSFSNPSLTRAGCTTALTSSVNSQCKAS